MDQGKRGRSGLTVKRLICMLLVIASLLAPMTTVFGPVTDFGLAIPVEAGYYQYNYYPRCASWHTSLVTALKSVGVDSSYNYRKYTIAPLNGYTSNSYAGTAAQNTNLLNLLKNGKLVKSKIWVNDSVTYYPRCASWHTSLVTALKSVGVDSSYNYRKYTIAPLNGYTSSSYTGTAAQNTNLLNLLKNGKLVKSKGNTPAPPTPTPTPKPKANSTLKIASGSYNPGTLTKGQGYTIGGAITSNYKITSVTVGIYYSNGTATSSIRTVRPNSYSYNIYNVDSYIKFGSLEVGSYRFKVTATDSYSVTKVLVNNPFTVVQKSSRSRATYNSAINNVDVYNYTRKGNTTYCNIFVQDVIDAMGLRDSYTKQRANATYTWLNNAGKNSKGWKRLTSASDAQTRANNGYPTLVIWYNPQGDPGHVAIVRPEGNGYYRSSSKGPVIANAGASTFAYGYVTDAFESRSVQYWTHD